MTFAAPPSTDTDRDRENSLVYLDDEHKVFLKGYNGGYAKGSFKTSAKLFIKGYEESFNKYIKGYKQGYERGSNKKLKS